MAGAKVLKPLSQMNGDNLQMLKRPLCSEMGREVVGLNNATKRLYNRKLDRWYKEQNFVLSKVKKGQAQVYDAMLRFHKERRKLLLLEPLNEKPKILEPSNTDVLQIVLETNNNSNNSVNENENNNPIVENNATETKKLEPVKEVSRPRKAGVLEVGKFGKTKFSVRTGEDELTVPNPKILNNALSTIEEDAMSKKTKSAESSKSFNNTAPKREIKNEDKEIESEEIKDKNSTEMLHLPDISFNKITTKAKKPKSLVVLNRKRAKEELRKQKDILNKEDFTTYTKNDSGHILPALVPFRRKEFRPPSGSEMRLRLKLQKQNVKEIKEHSEKLQKFYDLVQEENAIRTRHAQHFRARVPTPPSIEDTSKDPPPIGNQLEAYIKAYRPKDLPPGINPDSAEALRHCKYIRIYSPKTTEEREAAKLNKYSSWNPLLE